MQISSRVFLIASGDAGCSLTHPADCNVYAVRCGSRYLLIDSGVGIESGLLVDNLRKDGIRKTDVEALLLTHAHLDHAGGARDLSLYFQAPVFASSETAAALEDADEEAISLTAAKRAGIYGEDVALCPCPVDHRLLGDDRWQVEDCAVWAIRTPGHSRDMMTYLIQTPEDNLTFPGDTVFHGGKVLISNTWDCDPAAYGESLRKLAKLPIEGFYPGHSIWSVKDGSRHLKESVKWLDRLLPPPNLL